ncbi:hypothetical protein V8E55_001008 [Tylopilus felleus]
MSAMYQPISSPADHAAQLEMLRKIERLGGSAGYDSNSDAFSEFVPTLDLFNLDVWTRSIKELAKHPHDRAAQALKAKLQAELDLHCSNLIAARKQRVYEIIKGIESLGGSAGLEQFAKEPRATLPTADVKKSVREPTASWPFVYARGFAIGGLIVTAVAIQTADHHGSGYAWGPSAGAGILQGTLAYENYNGNGFHFQNLSGLATAEITSNGQLTAQFVGVLIGHNISLVFGGKWKW